MLEWHAPAAWMSKVCSPQVCTGRHFSAFSRLLNGRKRATTRTLQLLAAFALMRTGASSGVVARTLPVGALELLAQSSRRWHRLAAPRSQLGCLAGSRYS